MIDYYVPCAPLGQWARDPIASRLKPAMFASLRGEMVQLAAGISQKRVKKCAGQGKPSDFRVATLRNAGLSSGTHPHSV